MKNFIKVTLIEREFGPPTRYLQTFIDCRTIISLCEHRNNINETIIRTNNDGHFCVLESLQRVVELIETAEAESKGD